MSTSVQDPPPGATVTWNGSPTTLLTGEAATMPQTPNGTMLFCASNLSTTVQAGTLALTTEGAPPVVLQAPALTSQPAFLLQNWEAASLTVANVSAAQVPVQIAAPNPGIPGYTFAPLPLNVPVSLQSMQGALGTSAPGPMQLVTAANAPTLGIVAIIGGPQDASGNNGYAIAVNAPSNTGPGTGTPPPPGYYATTTAAAYTFPLDWGTADVFVFNLSPATSAPLRVTLQQLPVEGIS
jgi:hypothetical protein